jgi:hypothetical protein
MAEVGGKLHDDDDDDDDGCYNSGSEVLRSSTIMKVETEVKEEAAFFAFFWRKVSRHQESGDTLFLPLSISLSLSLWVNSFAEL